MTTLIFLFFMLFAWVTSLGNAMLAEEHSKTHKAGGYLLASIIFGAVALGCAFALGQEF
jgi:hypothetical protein